MKILVNYIATGDYFKYTEVFLKEIVKFCPGEEKIIVVRTDKIRELERLLAINFDYLNDRKVTVYYQEVDNLPWPLVTLFKLRHWLKSYELIQELGVDVDWTINLDATVIPAREVSADEFLFEGKIGAIQHFLWNQLLARENGREEIADTFWVEWNNSKSWRDSREINYQCFPGFVSCPIELLRPMCEEIQQMIEYDLRNDVIPYYHDEAYYNKYLDNHPELIQLVEDKIIEDDDPTTHNVKDPIWRVLSYGNLQSLKHNKE